MAQLESVEAIAKIPHTATRNLVVVIMDTGPRGGDACYLLFNPQMSELAALKSALLSRPSHATRGLEQQGYLTRNRRPGGVGRATNATLTGAGNAKITEVAPGHVRAVRESSSTRSPDRTSPRSPRSAGVSNPGSTRTTPCRNCDPPVIKHVAAPRAVAVPRLRPEPMSASRQTPATM